MEYALIPGSGDVKIENECQYLYRAMLYWNKFKQELLENHLKFLEAHRFSEMMNELPFKLNKHLNQKITQLLKLKMNKMYNVLTGRDDLQLQLQALCFLRASCVFVYWRRT